MRGKPLLITTLCLTLSLCCLAAVSQADPGHKGKKSQSTLKASLTPCCEDPVLEPEAEGRAKRTTQFKKGNVQKDTFTAEVTVPVPSTGLGIADQAAAEAADIRLVLSRGGTDYAECLLEIDQGENDEDEGESEATYQVDVQLQVKKSGPVLKEEQGTCDVDLGTDGVQPGVPDVQAGDVATAVVVVDPTDRTKDLPFVDGTFAQKK